VEKIVAVGAVIRDREGRVLLVRHVPERGGFWQGKWICPGGGLKFGETIQEGIAREVREETNLEIALTEPLFPFERIVKEGDDATLHVIYIDYLAELVGGELRPASDVGEALWVSADELPGMWSDLHEDTRILLRMANMAPVGEN